MINTLTKIKQIRVKDKDSQILFDPIDIWVDYNKVDVGQETLKNALEDESKEIVSENLEQKSVLKRIEDNKNEINRLQEIPSESIDKLFI